MLQWHREACTSGRRVQRHGSGSNTHHRPAVIKHHFHCVGAERIELMQLSTEDVSVVIHAFNGGIYFPLTALTSIVDP